MSHRLRTTVLLALVSAPGVSLATWPMIHTTSREMPLPEAVCLARAQTALRTAGFVQTPQTTGAWAYGHFTDYTAHIWCRPDVVLFIVAGPDNGSADRYLHDIVARF